MNKRKYKEFLKRYDKFKKNNLPTIFWDEERQTLEYVYYDPKKSYWATKLNSDTETFDSRLHIEKSLTEALENIASASFYYPYTCKYFRLPMIGETSELKIELGHTHSHTFENVVKDLYDFPESFTISKDEEEFYSKQELAYLRRVQKYLLFVGMKDIESRKDKVSRFRNKKVTKYFDTYIYIANDETINNFITGKQDFRINRYYERFECKKYKENEYRALIVDEEDNFKLFIEFTYDEIKTYKEVKTFYRSDKYEDNDKIVVTYFKILEIF